MSRIGEGVAYTYGKKWRKVWKMVGITVPLHRQTDKSGGRGTKTEGSRAATNKSTNTKKITVMTTKNDMIKLAYVSTLIAMAIAMVCTSCSKDNELATMASEASDITRDTTERVIDLSQLTANYVAQDGDILTGTLMGQYRISVGSDNATVTLRDVNITNLDEDSDWPGISCMNNTTLVLEGDNIVMSGLDNGDDWQHPGNCNYPGIYIAPGKTLIVRGEGSLTASPKYNEGGFISGCGIGGGYGLSCGSIRIEGGTINAIGEGGCAAIGAGCSSRDCAVSCGTITIVDGVVMAKAGYGAAGIGAGRACENDNVCGSILLLGGSVCAEGGEGAEDVGAGMGSCCVRVVSE